MEENQSHKLLIVDDEEPIRELISQIVSREGYLCTKVACVNDALYALDKEEFSLVISDINMPGKTGLDLLRDIGNKFPEMAVIMATAVDDRKVAVHTLEQGAYGYIIKPFDRNELLISIANAIRRRELEINNFRYSHELELLVQERTQKLKDAEQEIRDSREETIARLAKAAEFRDNETAQHTIRMGQYCSELSRKYGCDDDFCERMRVASPLHDVGKIGTPDTILLKPGRLTKEEFEIIKEHSVIGYRILADSNSDLLSLGASIALSHHEKYDGSGYPKGISGEDIPLEGRIAAVCDVFDALTSDRVYKKAMSAEKALDILLEGRGTHFDAHILDAFIEIMPKILVLKAQFADRD